MSPNAHIREELDRFRTQIGQSFYALQIDAPWGSGKTHFIADYLQKNLPDKGTDSGPIGLSLTLFGVRTVRELEQQLFAQLFSKASRTVGSIFSVLLTGAAGYLQVDKAAETIGDEARAKALSNRLQEVRGSVIVFDDLERSSMPLREALGYINRFVEHDDFRVVLISNEGALVRSGASIADAENAEVLKSFKEKLVGRTLRLAADPEAAYVAFAGSVANDEARNAALVEQNAAVQLFKASKRENLRSLRLGLEAYDRLISCVEPTIPRKAEGFRGLLLSCLYVALEHAAGTDGTIITDPHRRVLTSSMRRLGQTSDHQPSAEELVASELVSRYDDVVPLRSPVIPLDLIYDLIANGHLRKEDFNSALKISPIFADPKDVPPWRNLIQIWDLDTDTLKASSEQAIKQFHDLAVRDPGELLHLAGIMLWRQSYGDASMSGAQTPVDFVAEYLKRLHLAGQALIPNFKLFSFSHLAAYGYMALTGEETNTELKQIVGLIFESMNRAARARYPELYTILLVRLREKDRDLRDLLYGSSEVSQFLQRPMMEGQDPDRFAELATRSNKLDSNLLDWLKDRYRTFDLTRFSAELGWLEGLRAGLLQRIAGSPPPLQSFWSKIIEDRLVPVLEDLRAAGQAQSRETATRDCEIETPPP